MALSLFDEAVPAETKLGIVSAMIMVESDESDGDDEDPPKRVELKGSVIPPFESFATRKSMNLLKYLKINQSLPQ